jgi:hypothetical protein
MHRQIKRFTDMGGLSLFEGAFILVFRDTAGAPILWVFVLIAR